MIGRSNWEHGRIRIHQGSVCWWWQPSLLMGRTCRKILWRPGSRPQQQRSRRQQTWCLTQVGLGDHIASSCWPWWPCSNPPPCCLLRRSGWSVHAQPRPWSGLGRSSGPNSNHNFSSFFQSIICIISWARRPIAGLSRIDTKYQVLFFKSFLQVGVCWPMWNCDWRLFWTEVFFPSVFQLFPRPLSFSPVHIYISKSRVCYDTWMRHSI